MVAEGEGERSAGEDARGGGGERFEEPDGHDEHTGVDAQGQARGGLERGPPGGDGAPRGAGDAAVGPGEVGAQQEVRLGRDGESDGVGEGRGDFRAPQRGEDADMEAGAGGPRGGEPGETQEQLALPKHWASPPDVTTDRPALRLASPARSRKVPKAVRLFETGPRNAICRAMPAASPTSSRIRCRGPERAGGCLPARCAGFVSGAVRRIADKAMRKGRKGEEGWFRDLLRPLSLVGDLACPRLPCVCGRCPKRAWCMNTGPGTAFDLRPLPLAVSHSRATRIRGGHSPVQGPDARVRDRG